jgi:AhpC/TSA family
MSEITAYISQVRRSLYGRLTIAKSRVLADSTLSHHFVRMLRTFGPDRLVASQAGDEPHGFPSEGGEPRAYGPAPHPVLPVWSVGEPEELSGGEAGGSLLLPRDGTAGCTRQACAFREGHEKFPKLDAEVVGISSDPLWSHEWFAERPPFHPAQRRRRLGKRALRSFKHLRVVPRQDYLRDRRRGRRQARLLVPAQDIRACRRSPGCVQSDQGVGTRPW